MREDKARRLTAFIMSIGCIVGITELVHAEIGNPSWANFARGLSLGELTALLVFFVYVLFGDD